MASSELEKHNLAVQIAGVGPTDNFKQGAATLENRVGYLWTSESRIEGENNPTSSENKGDTFGLVEFDADNLTSGASATVREDSLLTEKLSGVGDSIDVFEANISYAAFDISLKASTFNVELLRSAERNPSFEVSADAKKTNGRIETTATNGELENTAGFIRDETLKFGTHDPTGSNAGEYDVVRGQYMSPQQHHKSGSKIFTSIPYWKNRKVRLYTYSYAENSNQNIQLVRRYVGLIDDGSTQHDHNEIIVPTTGIGSKIRGVQANNDAFNETLLASDGAGFEAKEYYTEDDDEDYYIIDGDLQFDNAENDAESKLRKQTEYTDGTDLRTWLQFSGSDSTIIYPYDGGLVGRLTQRGTVGLNGSAGGSNTIPFGFGVEDTPDNITRIHEPFIVHRLFDDDTIYSATRDITQFSDHDEKYIYHPASIVGCLLLSTYDPNVDAQNFDVLHGNWGSGAYSILSKSLPSDIRDIVEANPGDQVDQFVLGLQGQNENIWEACTRLLIQFGYYWTVSTSGTLSIAKITNSDVQFWNDAQDNVVQPVQSSTLFVDDGRDEVKDTLEGEVGKVGEIVRPQPIQVQFRQNEPNLSAKFSRSPDQKIQFDAIARYNDSKAKRTLRNLGSLQNYKRPRFEFQVDDYLNLDSSLSADYTLGAPVSIERIPLAKKWIARNGLQQRIDKENVEFAGRIVSRTYLPKKRAYTLEVEIIGLGLARWRSPSGVVKSVDSANNKITLENVNNGGDEVLRSTEPFHVGDEIQIFTEDGKQVDPNIQEITSILGDELTLDGFNYTTNPSPDDIVELAYLDTDESGDGYLNKSIFSNIDRPYVGLADTSSTLGDSGEDADIYGGRQ